MQTLDDSPSPLILSTTAFVGHYNEIEETFFATYPAEKERCDKTGLGFLEWLDHHAKDWHAVTNTITFVLVLGNELQEPARWRIFPDGRGDPPDLECAPPILGALDFVHTDLAVYGLPLTLNRATTHSKWRIANSYGETICLVPTLDQAVSTFERLRNLSKKPTGPGIVDSPMPHPVNIEPHDTHTWVLTDDRCLVCDCKPWGEVAKWPCGFEPPRILTRQGKRIW